MPPSVPTEDDIAHDDHDNHDDAKSDWDSESDFPVNDVLTTTWFNIGRDLKYDEVDSTPKCDRFIDFMIAGISHADSIERAMAFAQRLDLESNVLHAAVINKKFGLAGYIMANTELKLNASYIKCGDVDPEILGYLDQWKARLM